MDKSFCFFFQKEVLSFLKKRNKKLLSVGGARNFAATESGRLRGGWWRLRATRGGCRGSLAARAGNARRMRTRWDDRACLEFHRRAPAGAGDRDRVVARLRGGPACR